MKPGVYLTMNSDTYFADPCDEPSLSQSIAKVLLDRSPLHAKLEHPRLAPPIEGDEEEVEKYDKAKAIGNAAHAIMIRRGKKIAIIDAKDFKTKAAQTDKQAAIMAGAEPVLRKHYNTANDMVIAAGDQLRGIPECERAFTEGSGEVVIINEENGVWLRSMIDWLTPDMREVWDFKTSGMSASPYATGKLMASAGWHIQAAMHERILDALDPDGAGRRRFLYVCQENEPPYALTVNEISESALTIGRKQIDYAVNIWRDCLKNSRWPAYPPRIIRPELPGWSETSWLNREIAEHDDPPFKSDPKLIMAG